MVSAEEPVPSDAIPGAARLPDAEPPAGALLHLQVHLVAGALVGAAGAAGLAFPWAWLAERSLGERLVPLALGSGAAVLALVTGRPRLSPPVALGLLGALVPPGAVAGHHAFAGGHPLFVLGALAAVVGWLCAVAARGAFAELWPPARALGWLGWSTRPFHALALVCGAVLALEGALLLGPLRLAAAVGAALGAAALGFPVVRAWLWRAAAPTELRSARRSGLAALVAAAVTLASAEVVVPAGRLAMLPNAVVWASLSAEHEVVVTAGQGSLELHVDGRLRVSSLVQARWFEGLVQPAMAAAPRRTRVLLVGGGEGPAEREVLRHADVEQLTVLVPERRLVEIARRMPWLRRLSEQALDSPRLRIEEAEPLPWLAATPERFDVVLVDLPEPWTFHQGKNWTRHFFRQARERLAPGGVLVTHLATPLALPETAATLLATVRSAGLHALPYRVAVPTLGEWAFALCSVEPLAPPTRLAVPTTTWTDALLSAAFHFPSDARPRLGEPSTLDQQRAVHVFEVERAARFGIP